MVIRRLVSRMRGRLESERGVTLIELMVSLLIFAFVAAAVATGLGSSLNLVRNNRNRSIAAHLASSEMDLIRSTDVDQLPLGQVTSQKQVPAGTGPDYTITRDTSWVVRNASSNPCDSPSGSRLAYLRVTVEVSWPNMAGVPPVRSETLITPSAAAFDPDKGHIAVQVNDESSGPGGGHLVTVQQVNGSGVPVGAPLTQTTTDEGCAFFAYLTPASYRISLSRTGFVDPQGVSAPQQTAGVAAGQAAKFQFDYAAAADLNLTLGSSAYPVPANFPVVLGNGQLQPNGTKRFAGSGPTRSITGLFPFADQYGVWLGECSENNPAGNPLSLVAMQPGVPSSANVVSGRVVVEVTTAGVPTPGVPIAVSQAADTTEPDVCSAVNNLAVGTTGALGQVKFSLPYGTWTIRGPGGSTQQVTLTPSDDPSNPPTTVSFAQ
jgi:prepilin-type N-terminal cleavage/methylation domain-containing protein